MNKYYDTTFSKNLIPPFSFRFLRTSCQVVMMYVFVAIENIPMYGVLPRAMSSFINATWLSSNADTLNV